jgi:DNA-binding transcriptional LysR family regulator
MWMLPMNELAVFVAVVEAGSLSGAARRLGTSKAAVSDQVRRLEAALGASLLNRTTRRLSLTEAGRACYPHAVRMLAEAETAARSAAHFHDTPRGVLRVTAPPTFAPMYVVPILPAFRARNPELAVELDLSFGVVDIVKESFDLAIRIGELADSRLIARRLAVSRLVVCGSPDYLRRRAAPRTPDELADHDCLEFAPLGWRGAWRLVGPGGARRAVPIRSAFVSDSGDAILAAAMHGLGLAALPNWMVAPALKSGELAVILPGWGSRPVPIHAVYAPGGQTVAKVRLFVDTLAAAFRNAAWRS